MRKKGSKQKLDKKDLKKAKQNEKAEKGKTERGKSSEKPKKADPKDEALEALKAENERLQEELNEARKQLSSRDSEIQALRAKLRNTAGKGKEEKDEGDKVQKGSVKGKSPVMDDNDWMNESEGGDFNPNSVKLAHINLRKKLDGVFSDIQLGIIPGSESERNQPGQVHAHSAILSCRNETLAKKIADLRARRKKATKKHKGALTLDLKGSDVASMNHLFNFLYSEKLDLKNMNIIDVLFALMAARQYNVERMVWLCEDHLLKEMTMENIVSLLKAADVHKEQRVRRFCFNYLLKPENFTAFVCKPESVTELGLELFQEIVASNVGEEFKQPIELPTCPAKTLRTDFKTLYSSMEYSDAYVKFPDGTIPFHRAILAAHSRKFLQAFQRNKTDADMTHVLELGHEQKFGDGTVSSEAFASMLRFIYYGETKIRPLAACQLINFSDYFELNDLKKLCEIKIKGSVQNSKVVIRILAVTYLSIMQDRDEMLELRNQCIDYSVANLKEVDVAEIKDIEEGALEIAVDLLTACKNL